MRCSGRQDDVVLAFAHDLLRAHVPPPALTRPDELPHVLIDAEAGGGAHEASQHLRGAIAEC